MSRMGAKPIKINQNVTCQIKDKNILVKGKNGELIVKIPEKLNAEIKENTILITRNNNDKLSKSLHGTIRKLIINAIHGVENLFEKKLEVVGVGYRVKLNNGNLEIIIGYSHPVLIKKIDGIDFKVNKNTIIISGIDKQLVGQVSAQIRSVRPPEPYKGKGIKYSDENVRRKAGKIAKAAGAEGK